MKLYFLGTGAGIPSTLRNVSSLALILPEQQGETWLFDCGEATQHQVLRSPVRLSKLSRIFITHLHGDHIFGLPGLLSSRSYYGTDTPVQLYGPKGIREFIEVALTVSQTHLTYPLEIIEFEDGSVITDHPSFHITVRLLDHRIDSHGFRIVEKDLPGSLDVAALRKLGIQPGPIFQRLKNGETVQLPDGRWIDGKTFIGPAKIGRKLAILGDTRPIATSLQLAQDVDLLVHEATHRSAKAERANYYYHSTCTQAAETARDAGAKALILNHVSASYREEEWAEIEAEAREIFANTYVAHDHFSYDLGR